MNKVIACVLLTSVLITGQESLPVLAGSFRAEGVDEDGKYSGMVTILQNRRNLLLHWNIDQPTHTEYVGMGLITNQSVSASWAVRTQTGYVGSVIVYRIETPNRLVGEWPDGQGGILTETLTRVTGRVALR